MFSTPRQDIVFFRMDLVHAFF